MRRTVPTLILGLFAVAANAAPATISCPKTLALAVDQDLPLCVRAWLKAGASPDSGAGHPLGDHPLLLAIQRGNMESLQALLTAGAHPDARDRRGTPILLHAVSAASRDASGKSLDALRRLVEALPAASRALLAKDQAWIGDGRTALHQAAALGSVPILQLLLARLPRSSIDVANRYGETPLYLAAERGMAPAVKLLLEQGADFKARTTFTRMTALHAAAESGDPETVEVLMHRGRLSAEPEWLSVRNSFGKSALDLARAAVNRVPSSLPSLIIRRELALRVLERARDAQ